MKRAFVFRDKTEANGKVLALEDTIETFKNAIKKHFQLNEEGITLFFENGCEIHDIRLIRDEDKIYLSPRGSKHCNITTNMDEKLNIKEEQSSGVSDWITLNVGGKHFTTSRSTLLNPKEPSSMLARMFAGDKNEYLMNPSTTDKIGAYLIDRSPEYFEPILNYLRHGKVVLDAHVNPKGVLEEAIFYGKLFVKKIDCLKNGRFYLLPLCSLVRQSC